MGGVAGDRRGGRGVPAGLTQVGSEFEAVSSERVSDVLGNYPTGVVVLTALSLDGEFTGLLTASFAVISVDPPLVSFAASRRSAAFAQLSGAATFCVNLLAADQEQLCRRFAYDTGSESTDVPPWRTSPSGAPILDGVVSWMECRIVSVAEVDDHTVAVGTVIGVGSERDVLPLMYFQHGYGSFSPASLVTSGEREYGQSTQLAEAARESIELIARELAVECSVIVRLGGDAVFIATANHSPSNRPTRLGLRVPIAPPLGPLFVGSPGAPDEAAWLARLGSTTGDDAVRALAVEQLQRVRERGWSISLRSDLTIEELDAAVAGYTSPVRTLAQEQRLIEVTHRTSPMHEVADLVPGRLYDVLQLAVPVRNERGEVIAVLRLGDLPRRAQVDEIMFWVTHLKDTARAVEMKLAAS